VAGGAAAGDLGRLADPPAGGGQGVRNPEATEDSLLLRTGFSDDAAWAALCEAAQEPNEDGFKEYVDCASDPAYGGLTVE